MVSGKRDLENTAFKVFFILYKKYITIKKFG